MNALAQIRREVLASVKELNSDSKSSLSDLRLQLLTLVREGPALARELSIIESLRFPTTSMRQESIMEAHPKTFDWLFEDDEPLTQGSKVSLLDWLRNGHGIYWVSGKAGSGKSTLMKYLYNNSKTRNALRAWAGGKKLVIASFYFWNAGTDMQKSLQGLLQTLLYNVLCQCLELIPFVCSSRVHDVVQNPWTCSELLQAFKMLRALTIESSRFCFFIDGLDEYEGDHTEVIEIIDKFVGDIKVCFASRPWNVFENAYGDNHGQKLRLQDLTQGDISRFVNDKLVEDQRFQQLKMTDACYEDLVVEIVDRAEGVFLWVFLVVQSLRRGLSNSDTVLELQERLRVLPTDLEDYFKHMLDSVEKIYQKQAARIYLIRAVTPGDLTTMTVSFFDEKDSDFALEAKVSPLTRETIDDIRIRTNKRVLARCTDLLEISRGSKIVVLHRTVNGFLNTPKIEGLLCERAGAEFDAHRYLCNAMLCQIKHISRDRIQWERLTVLIDDFMYHAFQMELHKSFAYFGLFDELDQTVTVRRRSGASILNGDSRDLSLEGD